MATPVYGKQFIRFAETALVPETIPMEAFTLVSIAGVATEPPSLSIANGGSAVYGVLQQDMPAVDPERAVTLPRQATVATSGLLLVRCDDAALPAQNESLGVNGSGEALSGGTPVVINGTTPTVRQLVQIGGVNHALVSFN
jgi:hypothetical protein